MSSVERATGMNKTVVEKEEEERGEGTEVNVIGRKM